MSKEIEIRLDDIYAPVSFGGGGGGGGHATPSTPSNSTVAHDVCVAGYAGVGALAGGIATAETFGWGAVPGGMIGTAVGVSMCR